MLIFVFFTFSNINITQKTKTVQHAEQKNEREERRVFWLVEVSLKSRMSFASK